MKLMAANMKSDGGSRSTARAIYTQMYNEADDPQIKESAKLRLMANDALDELDGINSALKTFQQKNGRCVNNWSELFPVLQTIKLPEGLEFRLDKSNNVLDPTGAPYSLNKEKCEASVDYSKSDLIPIQE